MGFGRELLICGLLCTLRQCFSCDSGLQPLENSGCVDLNECEEFPDSCPSNTTCVNTEGSYYCVCNPGYEHTLGKLHFTVGECQDHNECTETVNPCGSGGTCLNLIGNFTCTCHQGYVKDFRGHSCLEHNCDHFSAESSSVPSFPGLADIRAMMRDNCLARSNANRQPVKGEGETLLEKLFTAMESVLSTGCLDSGQDVTDLLVTVEKAIMLIGPQLKHNLTKLDTTQTEAEIAVHRGKTPPTGPIHLSTENATVTTDWTTAAGTGVYAGFALAALLSYTNLNISVDRSFEELQRHDKDREDRVFQVFSRVVSVIVSNPLTSDLSHPVVITLRHLQDMNTSGLTFTCVYWSERGTWSPDGCFQESSNITHTVCKCYHLSSFAVLMALTPMAHTFGLLVVTQIGLAISLLCLILCILTFKFCRSIQGTRTTIHLHLCICLFIADLFFLAGISQTSPVGGCRFVAVMLHFFFLAAFVWMLLEGVQLYRMVVQVFNATIRHLYLFVTGYGIPLVIVIISASVRPTGYGTEQHCWLTLEDGLIWSFFGPVCFIIILNAFFFIITVWKLAQKFTSLNPDLSHLRKIRAFTVTAIAQTCILGLMWVFGAFLFQKDAIVVAYIFTILNSLQGALVFVMHCLLSKQVREEYANFLSCICTSQKKRYSDFSSTNPSSSQSQASRTGQQTGQSQI